MKDLLEAVANAITEGLKLANSAHTGRFASEFHQIRMDLIEEKAKGYDADDAKIETLYKKYQAVVEAARLELATARAPK